MDVTFKGTVTTFQPTDKGAEIDFSGCAPDDVAQLLGTFFANSGLRLEKGDPANGTYGSGSSLGRIAAGGFAGRRKYEVKLASADGATVHATVASAMSGMSGGAIGLVKERKQRRQFVDSLKSYLT
jgi:hypothetical protein